MSRRKGTPCACECDPCNSKNPIRAINNVSPEPNGDFTIEAGNGIGISTGENKITIINQSMASSFVAGDNIEINPSGDDLEIRLADNISITGDAVIGGDLTVNGTYYTVHAEHVYTEDDYIIMRDGATTGLGSGDFSGFQVKKYDGTNDGRLVIDNSGTARVGDVGDEQPLLTRDEDVDLTDGESLVWDSANSKAVTEAIPSAISTALNGKQSTITTVTNQVLPTNQGSAVVAYNRYGRIVTINFFSLSCIPGNNQLVASNFPIPSNPNVNFTLSNAVGQNTIHAHIDNLGKFYISSNGVTETSNLYGTVTYMITE